MSHARGRNDKLSWYVEWNAPLAHPLTVAAAGGVTGRHPVPLRLALNGIAVKGVELALGKFGSLDRPPERLRVRWRPGSAEIDSDSYAFFCGFLQLEELVTPPSGSSPARKVRTGNVYTFQFVLGRNDAADDPGGFDYADLEHASAPVPPHPPRGHPYR